MDYLESKETSDYVILEFLRVYVNSTEVLMKSIVSLKSRISDRGTITVQNEDGFVGEAGFEWRAPANDIQINDYETSRSVSLPYSFKEFLKISNGAVLFKDTIYGQWGCKILGVDELNNMAVQVKSWGYELKPEWIVFATWLGDCDMLVFDLSKCNSKNNDYILDGEQGEKVDDWDIIKGDFAKWIDRLIVSQGAKYWRWH